MAGIKANSVSVSMLDGDTAVDQAKAGYVTAEQVTLTTTPTGASYSWALSTPAGSTARADLSSTTAAGPVFTPDVAGYYVVTVTVGGSTAYILRLSVTQVAAVDTYEAVRFAPKAPTAVPTPPLGEAMFFSSTDARLVSKDTSGVVRPHASRLASYTVATLPSAATQGAGCMIYVSNELGGAVLAFSDGTVWRRCTDRAVVS